MIDPYNLYFCSIVLFFIQIQDLMHELSIVMSIIDIARKEAHNAGADVIKEIELEIGEMSGIEMESFNFAWNEAVKGTVLAGANLETHRPEGKGKCLECGTDFKMENLYDPCVLCNSYFVEIIEGRELSVKSITV